MLSLFVRQRTVITAFNLYEGKRAQITCLKISRWPTATILRKAKMASNFEKEPLLCTRPKPRRPDVTREIERQKRKIVIEKKEKNHIARTHEEETRVKKFTRRPTATRRDHHITGWWIRVRLHVITIASFVSSRSRLQKAAFIIMTDSGRALKYWATQESGDPELWELSGVWPTVTMSYGLGASLVYYSQQRSIRWRRTIDSRDC